MPVYYISFATDDEFLGAYLVEASSAETAWLSALLSGCNPGGEAAILGPLPEGTVKEEYLGRLLDKFEAEEAGA